jgi:hypothetical protein
MKDKIDLGKVLDENQEPILSDIQDELDKELMVGWSTMVFKQICRRINL